MKPLTRPGNDFPRRHYYPNHPHAARIATAVLTALGGVVWAAILTAATAYAWKVGL